MAKKKAYAKVSAGKGATRPKVACRFEDGVEYATTFDSNNSGRVAANVELCLLQAFAAMRENHVLEVTDGLRLPVEGEDTAMIALYLVERIMTIRATVDAVTRTHRASGGLAGRRKRS